MDDAINRLKRQFGDDFQYEKSESGAVKLTVTVRIAKKSEGQGDNASEPGFSATAVINCAPDYPESCASTQVVANSGVPAEVITQMTERLASVANEKKGEDIIFLLVSIVRRYLRDQRVHECPSCKAELRGGDQESWRSHCGHFFHRACIVSLIQNSARVQQENRPEGGDEQEQTAERRPVCPACGLYDFALRDDKPVSRRIKSGGGGRFRGRRRRNQQSAGDGETGEGEGEAGQGDQRRRRPRKPRNRRSGGDGGGEHDEATGGEGEVEAEGEAAPGQRRQRKKRSNRRRGQQQRSGGEGDVEGEGGDDPKLFNQRRQADMRFNEFEQFRNQVGGGKGGGHRGGGGNHGDFPQPGYIDENGGFYAPDGYYYYDGPGGFYAALEAFGGGGGGRGRGGRRRNRPRRPRGEGGNNGNAGDAPAENQSDPVAAD